MPIGFESGVPAYVYAVGKISVYFPIDRSGKEHCCCEQCHIFLRTSQVCPITGEKVLAPNVFVGEMCPLMRIFPEQDSKIDAVFGEIAAENAPFYKNE